MWVLSLPVSANVPQWFLLFRGEFSRAPTDSTVLQHHVCVFNTVWKKLPADPTAIRKSPQLFY